MIYIECPKEEKVSGVPTLFLGGGITGCPDWQKELCYRICDLNVAIYNPRRQEFDTSDSSASEKQIAWEYKHLHLADAITFWFPKESICPIALYELGYWNASVKNGCCTKLFVGHDQDYPRKEDVKKQTALSNRSQPVDGDFRMFVTRIRDWIIEAQG